MGQLFNTCPVCGRKKGWNCIFKVLWKKISFVLLNPRIVIGLLPHILKLNTVHKKQYRQIHVVQPRSFIRQIQDKLIDWCENYDEDFSYQRWIENNDSYTKPVINKIKENIEQLKPRTRFPIIIYVTPELLATIPDLIHSLLKQLYSDFEIVLTGTGFKNDKDAKTYFTNAGLNEHIIYGDFSSHNKADSINKTLELISDNYFFILEPYDRLSPKALYYVACTIEQNPDIVVLYTDEDKIDNENHRSAPFFKTDWNPDLFYSFNYIGQFTIFKRQAVIDAGGFRKNFSESIQYELILRLSEQVKSNRIVHIPMVLHHRIKEFKKKNPLNDNISRIAALQEHFKRTGQNAELSLHSENEKYIRVKFLLPLQKPQVSIIIPSKDNLQYLQKCVESVIAKTDYPNYEIVIVDNGSKKQEVHNYLEQLQKRKDVNLQILSYNYPFNFAAINNFAVSKSKGEVLCFLNDDTEVISAEWLTEMVSHAMRPEIGVVGAKLYFPDDTLQHVGMLVGLGGFAGHILWRHFDRIDKFNTFTKTARNVSAVTGACLLIQKKIFLELNGFDENDFIIAYNDVDLCLKAIKKGYRIVWTPYAELYHHECVSRGYFRKRKNVKRYNKESQCFANKWSKFIEHDPYYNQNLTNENVDCRVITTSRY